MDATGNELVETQYYGCCVVDLYNRGRPHSRLGPGIPDPNSDTIAPRLTGHEVERGYRVRVQPILGGLHHEYRLEAVTA
jgi:hypothetical protein